MRKILTCLLLACFLIPAVCAEENYQSIVQLRETTPARLTQTYENRRGETVAVDAPIVLPQIDRLPVLNVRLISMDSLPDSYKGKAVRKLPDSANYALCWNVSHEGYEGVNVMRGLEAVHQPWTEAYAENSDVSPAEIQTLFETLMCDLYGMEPGADYAYSQPVEAYSRVYLFDENKQEYLHPLSEKGSYCIQRVRQVFYGAQLWDKPIYFVNSISGGRRDPVQPCPFFTLTADDLDHFDFVSEGAVEEAELLAEDVPLLPFAAVLPSIEALIESGSLIRVDEIRLCDLQLFVTPEGDRDIFRAMPCWQVTGLVREKGASRTPRFPRALYINAQTGEFINPESAAPARARAGSLITWEQLAP